MKTVFTTFCLCIALFASAQNTFKKRFPLSSESVMSQVIQLNDGSLVAVGTNNYDSTGSYAFKIFLVKMNADGDVLNSYLLGNVSDSLFQYGYSLAKASDGGFVVGCTVDMTATLLKFDAGINLVWQETYPVEASSAVQKIVQTPDGGYLMGGNTVTTPALSGQRGFFVIRTDGSGKNASFKKVFVRQDEVDLIGLAATTDGNYAMLSATKLGDTSYLTKIDGSGAVMWSKALQSTKGGKFSLYARALTPTSDGGLLISGERDTLFSSSNAITSYIPFMVKYNNSGDTVWSRAIVLPANSKSNSLWTTEDNDGSYLFAGFIDNYDSLGGQTNSNAYAAKLTAAGAFVWLKTIEPSTTGTNGYIRFESIVPTTDNGYVVCGERSFSADAGVSYTAASIVYKYDSNFESCNGTSVDQGSLSNFSIISNDNTPVFQDIALTDSSGITEIARNAIQGISVCSSAFPLQLLSFTATLQGRSVGVNWQTANEVNTDYFVVEKSANKSSFTALQKVAAKGSSSLTQTYSISDLQPLQGTSYYRLKQVDKDGKTVYSAVVPVVVTGNDVIVISPNPVQGTIHVVMQSAANNTLTLQVVDMKGSVLAAQTRAVSIGRNEISIPAASLAKGVYVLRVIDNRSAQSIRFMKE